MKDAKNLVVSINAGIVLVTTVILNILAYSANEAKGIGYIYFAVVFLLVNILILMILTATSFLRKKRLLGKNYAVSILISLVIFVLTFVLFWLINS